MSKRSRPKANENVSTSSLGPKRPRRDGELLPPLIFVVTEPGAGYNCYYFDSQDTAKRRRVLDRITGLSAQDADGPVKATWLLDWLAENIDGDIYDNVPADLVDDVVEAYIALNPLEGEWEVESEATMIKAQPQSVITFIRFDPQ